MLSVITSTASHEWRNKFVNISNLSLNSPLCDKKLKQKLEMQTFINSDPNKVFEWKKRNLMRFSKKAFIYLRKYYG